MTKDGPDPNKPCVFPFFDRGISHSKCTSGASDLQPWCPTEVDQNGYYINEKWGNCESNCETGKVCMYILRRPQNFPKSPPFFVYSTYRQKKLEISQNFFLNFPCCS